MNALKNLALMLLAALLATACGGAADPEIAAEDTATTVDEAPEEAEAEDTADTATDADEAAAELTISDVRSRMSPRMAGVGAIYLEIENATDVDDRLVAAYVPAEVAGRVEIHETYEVDEQGSMEDDHDMGNGHMDDDADDLDNGHMGENGHDMGAGTGMMGMREIEAIEVPAGDSVSLVPGGLHIMLFDLVSDLEPGDTYELTLEFEQAGSIEVIAEVREHV